MIRPLFILPNFEKNLGGLGF